MLATQSPSVGAVISGALRDCVPLFMQRRTVYAVLIVLATLSSLTAFTQPAVYRAQALIFSMSFGGLATFWILPAVMRTFIPHFRMTFGSWVVFFVVSLGVGIAAQIGSILLVVPGVYIGIKWAFAPYLSLLNDGQNSFSESFAITRGAFWPTFALFFVMAMVVAIALGLLFGIGFVAVSAVSIAVIVASPIITTAYILALNFAYLTIIRWMMALRERTTGTGSGASVVATIAR